MVGSIPVFSDFFLTGEILLFHEKLFLFLPYPQLKCNIYTHNRGIYKSQFKFKTPFKLKSSFQVTHNLNFHFIS